jgi:hypothetical protein
VTQQQEVLFAGAKAKLKRAETHIKELHGLITAFISSKPYRVSVELNPNGLYKTLKLTCTSELPDETGAVLGDALHNLRTPLDRVAAELVRLAGNVPGRDVYFPVRKTREELVKAINRGEISVAPQSVIDVIVNVAKPYTGGNDALCVLHALDITDKHLGDVPTVAITGAIVNGTFGSNRVNNFHMAVGGTGEINGLAFPANENFQGNAKALMTVVFGKGQPFEGKPVIEGLTHLHKLITGIVQAIEDAYVRSVQPTS